MNLAYRLRPQNLQKFVGQDHLIGSGRILQKMLDSGQISSMLFWGPPGSGKTTLAHIITSQVNAHFHMLSAVETGKADLRNIIEQAESVQKDGRPTILFLDEIHRWNKAQQDSLLPYVESGLIILIGATTENPSFEVISALLSRCRVFVLKALDEKDLQKIIHRALTDQEKGLGKYGKSLTPESEKLLIRLSGGDARIMLNALEMSGTTFKEKEITPEIIKEVFQTRSAGLYDKKADEHYNIVSAFIKSVRGSDVDASLYYLARMLESGEDPKFIARRMIILASEDIGLADRGALIQANAAFEAITKIGMPESQLILAHVTVYLAQAKKSRTTTNALLKAKKAVYDFPNEPIPLHLRNAPTKLMSDLGYAKDYERSDDYSLSNEKETGNELANNYVNPKEDRSFLPEKLKNKKFFN